MVSDPIGAAVAFGKLINNNADLLKRYVSRPIIQAFKDLIKSKGLQSRLLSFFATICTCKQKAILSNQEAVLCELWLDEPSREQTLFRIFENDDMAKATNLETVLSPVPDSFLGIECITDGFKEVLVDWSAIELLSNFKILGSQTVSVEQLCWVLEPEHLCQVVTGRNWEEVQMSFSPVIDSLGNIVRMSDANMEVRMGAH